MKNKHYQRNMALPIFILSAFSLTIILVFILIFSISLTGQDELSRYGFKMLPRKFDISAYKYVLKNMGDVLNAYKISIVYSLLGTALSVMIMSMLGYSISRPEFKLRKAITFFVFFTILFNGGLTPSYILITQYLKIKDTIWALMLPGLVNCFHVLILRTFFNQLPLALFESMEIDGAGEITIFLRMVIPLSKPAIATVAFMGIIARWNDWFTPMLYITKGSLYPLQYILQSMLANIQFVMDMMKELPGGNINIQDIPRENLRMAMMVVTVFPMLCIFPFFQKYFVKGITVGSIK